MFLKSFLILNTFALGIVVGVLTQTEIEGLPNLRLSKPFDAVIPQKTKVTEQGLVRTTAYCHLENEPGAVRDLNCLGTTLRYYKEPRSAAADWSKYPVGTQFRIVGAPHLYEIDDYGSGLVGTDTIDLYKPTLELMDEWGVRQVEIKIVKLGSFERSAEIMAAKTQFPHIVEMLRCVQPRLDL